LIASGAANNVQGAYVTVGPDHAVYVFFFEQSSPQRIRMRKSTDQGVTFGAAVTVATLATTSTNGDLGLGGGFRNQCFPFKPWSIRSIMTSTLCSMITPPGQTKPIFSFPVRRRRRAWSAPVTVNDDGTTNDQWQPTLAVMPNGERLFVSFYDRRLDVGNSLIDTFA